MLIFIVDADAVAVVVVAAAATTECSYRCYCSLAIIFHCIGNNNNQMDKELLEYSVLLTRFSSCCFKYSYTIYKIPVYTIKTSCFCHHRKDKRDRHDLDKNRKAKKKKMEMFSVFSLTFRI